MAATSARAVLNNQNIFGIVDAGYNQQKDPSVVLKELHDRGYKNVSLQHVESQFNQWDRASTDEPNWS